MFWSSTLEISISWFQCYLKFFQYKKKRKKKLILNSPWLNSDWFSRFRNTTLKIFPVLIWWKLMDWLKLCFNFNFVVPWILFNFKLMSVRVFPSYFRCIMYVLRYIKLSTTVFRDCLELLSLLKLVSNWFIGRFEPTVSFFFLGGTYSKFMWMIGL